MTLHLLAAHHSADHTAGCQLHNSGRLDQPFHDMHVAPQLSCQIKESCCTSVQAMLRYADA